MDGVQIMDIDVIAARLVALGREHGSITFDMLSEALATTALTSRQFEIILFRLNMAKIDIVDSPPPPPAPATIDERAIRRLEQAVAALRGGDTAHAVALLKTTLRELDEA